MASDAAAFRTVQPLEYYLKFLEQGVRPDGRALLRPRKATATGGVVSSAAGSCTMKLGQTVVIAGVHCEPAVPTQAEPTLGRVIVSLEVSAVASAAASSGQRGSTERQNRELGPLLELLQRVASDDLLDLQALCIFYPEYDNKSNKCYKCYKKWIYHTIYKEARRCRRRGTASAPALPSLPASARTELSLGHTPPAPTRPRSASNIARWMELTQLGSKSIMLVNDDEPTIATNTRSAPQLSPHILV